MSDYIRKRDALKIIEKETKRTNSFIEHNTQLHIKIAVEELPTVDEKEIIRKAFERVVERLEAQAGEFIDLSHRELSNTSITAKKYLNKGFGVAKAIEIVKEECGISE